jgi:cell division protein DivIC
MALGDRKVLNPFKPMLNRLPNGFRNRVFIVLAAFILWMLFFDKASIYKQYRLSRTVSRLKMDKVFYQDKIKEAEQQRLDIQKNPEKFARERYFMKAGDEDVFIIEKESK